MTTFAFCRKYLNEDAIITIASRRGGIEYTGPLADCRFRLLHKTKFESVTGLGSENDLIIFVSAE